jgi:hypothetical protein
MDLRRQKIALSCLNKFSWNLIYIWRFIQLAYRNQLSIQFKNRYIVFKLFIDTCIRYIPPWRMMNWKGCGRKRLQAILKYYSTIYTDNWFLTNSTHRQRSPRNEVSSPTQKLGSWDRIPLEAWISVRVSCAFLFCVSIGLGTGPRSPTGCLKRATVSVSVSVSD